MKPGESLISPEQVTVTPGYFEAMHIAMVTGRPFDQRDHATAPGAIIVDERLAHPREARKALEQLPAEKPEEVSS